MKNNIIKYKQNEKRKISPCCTSETDDSKARNDYKMFDYNNLQKHKTT